jgi:hypothetical protein
MRTEILQFLFFVSTIRLEDRNSFTYLGMLFDKHMNLYHAASHALKSFNAALRRVKESGIEKRNSDRPHAMLWHVKTYALSAGMYASQIRTL